MTSETDSLVHLVAGIVTIFIFFLAWQMPMTVPQKIPSGHVDNTLNAIECCLEGGGMK